MKYKKCILTLLLVGLTAVFSLQVTALENVAIKVGNHGQAVSGNGTNMVVEFVLGIDITPGFKFSLDFDPGAVNKGTMFATAGSSSLDIDPDTDFAIEVAGNDTYYSIVDSQAANVFGLGLDDTNDFFFIYPPTSITPYAPGDADGDGDIDAGTLIRLFIGPDDDITVPIDYAVGETAFNDASTHFVYNPPSPQAKVELAIFDGAGTTTNGAYSLDGNGADPGFALPVTGTMEPYINFDIPFTSANLGTFNTDEVNGGKLYVNVETNAEQGMRLYYRSSPLALVNDATIYIPSVGDVIEPGVSTETLTNDGSSEGWGIKVSAFRANIIAPYESAGYEYSIRADNVLDELANSLVPTLSNLVINVGCSITDLTEAGQYQAIITFNLFTNF